MAHGAVQSAQVVTDKHSGESRGFGFVEMASEADAEAAMSALNETELGGRRVTVAPARPREDRNGGGRWYRRSSSEVLPWAGRPLGVLPLSGFLRRSLDVLLNHIHRRL